MAKWLIVKDGKVVGVYAPREDSWKRHYQAMVKAGKYQAFVEAEDSEPASEGWFYQDGKFSAPEGP
jgi:hypothetical protein